MRVAFNTLLAFLLLGALLWGNCICCRELAPSIPSHAPAHGCCGHPGKQPVNAPDNCRSFALKHFVKTAPAPQAQPHFATNARFAAAGAPPVSPAAPRVARFVIPHPPFDLQVLNSNIRI